MRLSTHGVIALAGIALAYGGFLLACPELSNEIGLDAWNWGADQEELEICRQHSAELAQVGKRVDQRIRLKSEITLGLIDGQITLAGAAADFQALNQIEPEIETATHQIYRGQTVNESTALQVIAYARVMTSKSRPDRREVLDRLEGDFERLMGKKPVLFDR
jgi:hypothetical protein